MGRTGYARFISKIDSANPGCQHASSVLLSSASSVLSPPVGMAPQMNPMAQSGSFRLNATGDQKQARRTISKPWRPRKIHLCSTCKCILVGRSAKES
jgi:hypothetical protein